MASSATGVGVFAAIGERLRADLPVTVVFQYPTIREMATVVESAQGGELEEGVL